MDDIIILNQASPEFSMSGVLVAAGGAATISRGTPTKAADARNASPWTGAVVPMVDGDGTTAQFFTGIAKSISTDTASAAGSVDLWIPLPGYIYAAKAKTASTFDTAAEVQAAYGKPVFFDLTSTTWSVDVGATTDKANCVVIVGGDYQTQTVWFYYRPCGTMLDWAVSA